MKHQGSHPFTGWPINVYLYIVTRIIVIILFIQFIHYIFILYEFQLLYFCILDIFAYMRLKANDIVDIASSSILGVSILTWLILPWFLSKILFNKFGLMGRFSQVTNSIINSKWASSFNSTDASKLSRSFQEQNMLSIITFTFTLSTCQVQLASGQCYVIVTKFSIFPNKWVTIISPSYSRVSAK